MHRHISPLILAAAAALAGCSNDGPATPDADAPVVAVETTDIPKYDTKGSRTYTYDSERRVTYIRDAYGNTATTCEYTYGDGTISIVTASDVLETESVTYHDEVELNDGLVRRITGINRRYDSSGDLLYSRYYSSEYTYDGNRRLQSIKRSQWNSEADKDRPWTWTNTLKWEGNRIVEYVDCYGHESPIYTYKYKYGNTTLRRQVVVPFSYHPQYDALMLAGYFGRMPMTTLESRTRHGIVGDKVVRKYDYSVKDGLVENYVTAVNAETEYEYEIITQVTYL